MTTEPTVFIVDDDPAVRESTELLLQSRGIGTRGFPEAQTFLDAYRPNLRGCVLVDVRMPGLSGLDLQARLAGAGSTLPVIVVTGHGDVPMAVRAIKAGALDFLQKPFDARALEALVRQALDLDDQRRREQQRIETERARVALLTERERQVLARISQGHYNRVIADELGISISTVEAHRRNVMDKLRAHTMYELVRIVDTYL
ncbi:response regulator [Aquisalimonas sp.]|uniref:response regulator transcription factor n=1 Tax=unclassified Aquisalimonas TaxID=2644645 RepID=UPI0025BC14A4|nr:response regulator [Aquisalimonas sp.]